MEERLKESIVADLLAEPAGANVGDKAQNECQRMAQEWIPLDGWKGLTERKKARDEKPAAREECESLG
jgi:hypothetical protein